ncbi:MAG: hypothetical protein ACHQTE_00190 [Candidatus Saccharimonadales bacterium]
MTGMSAKPSGSSFLDEWLAKRQQIGSSAHATPSAQPQSPQAPFGPPAVPPAASTSLPAQSPLESPQSPSATSLSPPLATDSGAVVTPPAPVATGLHLHHDDDKASDDEVLFKIR